MLSLLWYVDYIKIKTEWFNVWISDYQEVGFLICIYCVIIYSFTHRYAESCELHNTWKIITIWYKVYMQ